MVAKAGHGGLREWGFHEEPPPRTNEKHPPPVIGRIEQAPDGSVRFTGAVTKREVTLPGGFEAHPLMHADGASGVGGSKRFSSIRELTVEIFRLKGEIPKQEGPARVALARELGARQAEWVMRAKFEKLPEPSGRLDPLKATPSEIATAFMWSEAGGVIPRSEIERDGGRAFKESVRDAVTHRLRGFDAMVELHRGRPAEQRSLLVRSLRELGVEAPVESGVEALRDLRRDVLLSRSAADLARTRELEAKQLYIGLDGFVGTSERLDAYERDKRIEAANPGTTLGSIYATYLGGDDVTRMRAVGSAGNALEGMGGGAALHVKKVSDERELVPHGASAANHGQIEAPRR